ncbi:MAG: hypothetical protein MJZ12_00110 [Prevotella sp.]|nr:hypothetical protein [Prevotella sp.]
MKANELMIGDWVYASGYIKSNMQISGVRQFDVDGDRIFKDDVRHTTMFIPYKNLEPIHLTTEVLEKNGYHYFVSATPYYYNEEWDLEIVKKTRL